MTTNELLDLLVFHPRLVDGHALPVRRPDGEHTIQLHFVTDDGGVQIVKERDYTAQTNKIVWRRRGK